MGAGARGGWAALVLCALLVLALLKAAVDSAGLDGRWRRGLPGKVVRAGGPPPPDVAGETEARAGRRSRPGGARNLLSDPGAGSRFPVPLPRPEVGVSRGGG